MVNTPSGPPGSFLQFKLLFIVLSYDDIVGAANVTNLPKTNANTLYFSARATNGRPYIHDRGGPININLKFCGL